MPTMPKAWSWPAYNHHRRSLNRTTAEGDWFSEAVRTRIDKGGAPYSVSVRRTADSQRPEWPSTANCRSPETRSTSRAVCYSMCPGCNLHVQNSEFRQLEGQALIVVRQPGRHVSGTEAPSVRTRTRQMNTAQECAYRLERPWLHQTGEWRHNKYFSAVPQTRVLYSFANLCLSDVQPVRPLYPIVAPLRLTPPQQRKVPQCVPP